MAQIHDLKILPEYYDAVDKGVKTYELRFDDRNYAVGADIARMGKRAIYG